MSSNYTIRGSAARPARPAASSTASGALVAPIDLMRAGVLLTIPQAAAVLNVPEGALRKLVSAREFPFTRLGKHVRFSARHVDAIIAAGEQELPASLQRASQIGAAEPILTPLPTRPRGGRRRSTL